MTSGYLKRTIGGAILSFSVLLGVALASSATAQAQYPYGYPYPYPQHDRDRDRDRDWDRDRDYRRGRGYDYGSFYRVAEQRGQSDGFYTGENDAQRGQSYDPQRSHFYRNATSGYNGYGDKSAYRRAYRDGFLRGYNEGYQRYGGRRWRYGRIFPF